MICHHYKCLFIHIPKNAGQSIERVFLKALDLTWETRAPLLLMANDRPELGPPRLAHLMAEEYVSCKYLTREIYEEYFKFAFVRNPWSRMVSIYKYLGHDKKHDFKSFLMGPFRKDVFTDMHWFVRPQSDFIFNDKGDLLVDFVGRVENLQDDFDHVCEKIGLPATQVPHTNKSKERAPSAGTAARDFFGSIMRGADSMKKCSCTRYQDYYDQETIDQIADIYRRDIELFKYDFC